MSIHWAISAAGRPNLAVTQSENGCVNDWLAADHIRSADNILARRCWLVPEESELAIHDLDDRRTATQVRSAQLSVTQSRRSFCATSEAMWPTVSRVSGWPYCRN